MSEILIPCRRDRKGRKVRPAGFVRPGLGGYAVVRAEYVRHLDLCCGRVDIDLYRDAAGKLWITQSAARDASVTPEACRRDQTDEAFARYGVAR